MIFEIDHEDRTFTVPLGWVKRVMDMSMLLDADFVSGGGGAGFLMPNAYYIDGRRLIEPSSWRLVANDKLLVELFDGRFAVSSAQPLRQYMARVAQPDEWWFACDRTEPF